MVQVIQTGNPQGKLSEMLGMSLGQGIGNGLNTFFANRSLESVLKDKALNGASTSKKLEAMRSALAPYGEVGQNLLNQRMQIEQQELNEMQTAKQEVVQKKKGQALGRYLKGGDLTPDEESLFTPTEFVAMHKARNPPAPGGVSAQPVPPEVQSSISNVLKENTGSNADELSLAMDQAGVPRSFSNSYVESRRRSDEADDKSFDKAGDYEDKILSDYSAYRRDSDVLSQMMSLADKGNLPNPLLAQALESMGFPIGALKNPDAEQFDKLSQELVKNISGTYGNRILKVEVDNFLKTIPTLMNSEEGKKRLIRQWEIINEGKKAKYDAYRELQKEFPKKLPKDYKFRAQDIADKKLDQLSKEFRSIGLEQNRVKVPKGTPLNNETIQKYLDLANEDADLAKKMALEDGYAF